jgi:hypothetical protein
MSVIAETLERPEPKFSPFTVRTVGAPKALKWASKHVVARGKL